MAKWFKNFGKSALIGAGAGLVGSAIPGVRNFTPLISAGAGALADKDNRLRGAAAGLTGNVGMQTLSSGFKNAMTGTGGTALNRFSSGAGEGYRNSLGSMPGMKGFGTNNPQGALAKFFTTSKTAAPTASAGTPATSLPSGLAPAEMTLRNPSPNMSTDVYSPYAAKTSLPTFNTPVGAQAVTGMPSMPNVSAAQAPGTASSTLVPTKSGGFLDNTFKDVIPGMAVSMAGNMFAPEVEAPDWSGQTAALREAAMTGANPEARALGMGELRDILTSNVATPPENAFSLGDEYAQRNLDDSLKALEQQFVAANPGANVENNSAYLRERERLIQANREQRAMARDAQTFEYMQAQQARQAAAMQTALNLDDQQMNYLYQIAQLDINQIMMQTGLEAGEAAALKEMFGTIGAAMISGAQDRRLMEMYRGGAA